MSLEQPLPNPSLDSIRQRVGQAVSRSPADETSISWLERRPQRTGSEAHPGARPHLPRRHVLVRVIEAGRLGTFRTTVGDDADLELAVRHAMAHARSAVPVPGFPHLAADSSSLPDHGPLHDERLVDLDPAEAAATLKRHTQRGETARLDWNEILLVVASSKGVDRAVEITEAELQVRCGRRPGAGFASATSRRLEGLPLVETFERARNRSAGGEVVEPPSGPCSVLLSPEAAATLVDLLSRLAFTAEAYQHGDSFLRQFLGVQTFDRSISIRDDATDPAGLPFPFDLEGTAKRTVELIDRGVPRTPALDQLHAATLGLPPTPHASAGDDARAEHLFVAPGSLSDDGLLDAAEGGIWIARFDRTECYEPRRLHVRTVARGVRRINRGRLAEAVPDLVWDESLLQALGHVIGLGAQAHLVSDPSGHLGAISTPAVTLGKVTGLSPWIGSH